MEDDDDNGFLSALYHALRSHRRRRAIRYLHRGDSPMLPVRTLAREITAVEQGVPLNDATGESYRNVYNALSQTHLPTLADAGIIIYDPERQTVSEGPNLSLAALLVAISRPAIETLQNGKSTDGDDPQ